MAGRGGGGANDCQDLFHQGRVPHCVAALWPLFKHPHQSPPVRTPLPLPPPATACNLDDIFSLKEFAKKRFHPANGCSETFSSGHLSSPSSAASSKLEKKTVKKRREGLTCVSCCCCLLLLLLQGSVIAATAALLPEADSVFFSQKRTRKQQQQNKNKCRLKFFQQRKCVFIQLLTGFDKSCSGKLAASRKNAKLQTLQRLQKVLLDVREFPLHVFWMLLLLFSSSCSMDVETAGLKV